MFACSLHMQPWVTNHISQRTFSILDGFSVEETFNPPTVLDWCSDRVNMLIFNLRELQKVFNRDWGHCDPKRRGGGLELLWIICWKCCHHVAIRGTASIKCALQWRPSTCSLVQALLRSKAVFAFLCSAGQNSYLLLLMMPLVWMSRLGSLTYLAAD